MSKTIGQYIHEFDEVGLKVVKTGSGVLLVSVPPRAPNGMISEELVTWFSQVINRYVTGGKCNCGVIQVQHIVREESDIDNGYTE